jgi:hypothetical protein
MKFMIELGIFSKVFAGFVQSVMADPAQVVCPVWAAGEAEQVFGTTEWLLTGYY